MLHWLLYLYYLVLFLSLDILLYLRFGKKVFLIQSWLILVGTILIITLILHLPYFKLSGLMSFDNFMLLFGMVIQMIVVRFMGMFVMKKLESFPAYANNKESLIIDFQMIFKTGIFWLFGVLHTIYILSIAMMSA